ncbi:hypothetical protein L1049_020613 [Liquidambar formosana]|uniref:Rab-GAP TBC domain-containing protein n=1 Tax=Liquidambar formosana TaxID=63359 RepID=A0AAP0S7F3_LIQFO
MKALRRSHTSSSSNSSPPSSSSSSSSSSSWIHLRSVLFVVASSSPAYSCSSSDRSRLKSPWSRRKRKHVLSPQQWRSLFTPDGKLRDGGVKCLKKVRSGGVDPSIRAEVWPFLLGVYDLNSSKEERDIVRNQKRKEYEKLRRQCRRLLKRSDETKLNETGGTSSNGDSGSLIQFMDSSSSEDVVSARESLSSEERSPDVEYSDNPSSAVLDGDDSSRQLSNAVERIDSSRRVTNADASTLITESSDSESSEDPEVIPAFSSMEGTEENDPDTPSKEAASPSMTEVQSKLWATEDFATWQRIIRLDAVRANSEWTAYAPSQASVSDGRARRSAEAVGLRDYDHLEPSRIFHAARLVAILEAYALYDPEIGYCQGMSDLLSPIITVIGRGP